MVWTVQERRERDEDTGYEHNEIWWDVQVEIEPQRGLWTSDRGMGYPTRK